MRRHYKSGLPRLWRKSRIPLKPANDGRHTSTSHRFQHAGVGWNESVWSPDALENPPELDIGRIDRRNLSITHKLLQRATHGVGTMKSTAARFSWIGVSLCGLMFLGWVVTGQAAKSPEQGLPTDWSHSHVIFAHPASAAQERSIGQDPRYWQQRYRREIPQQFPVQGFQAAPGVSSSQTPSAGLWAENMGASGAAGPANYPAKYSFSLTTANCGNTSKPDYVVYSTGLLGSGTQASIVAFDNIYNGCSGAVPSTYWAFNTGGLILTSPLISLDGTQIAFVQTSGSPTGNAGLVLVKWKASTMETITSPGVPTSVTAAQYPTCVAPCMTEVFLQKGGGGNVDDRTSSPYYDYSNDIVWVGGSGGWLHKITGVFKGTPAEVTASFPVKVNTGNALSGPLYDHTSQNVLVGDVGTGGGFLYRVNSSTGVATASGQLDFGVGLVESPLLDVTGGKVYAFASSDGTTSCAGGVACAAVYTLSTSFGAGTTGTKVTVGNSVLNGSTPNPMYVGAFDSAYYNSTNATGALYVCGNTGGSPVMYRIPVVAGVMGSPVPGASLTPAGRIPACSPVTDFPNPNASPNKAELLYFSVQNFGRPCGNKGCMMNFVDLPWQASTHYNAGEEILVIRTANNVAYIQIATNSGTTGATIPIWPGVVGRKTVDSGITWLNQGATTVVPLVAWTANHNYALQNRIFDGTNVEIVTQAGLSGATQPTWNTTIAGTTNDNAAIWINAGPWPSSSLTLAGGTGGVIVDGMSTATGASQIYFFTQGNQTCTTSGGTGVCAVQASQANLQ